MVVDTSALIAILADEPERRPFIDAIEAAGIRLISAATFVEASIVLETRHGADGSRLFDLFLDRAGIDIVDVDAEQAREARRGFARFGKGRHPAGLNFGDCFAYALSLTSGEPLLFKGNDFSQTDVEAVA
ncbi:MAG: type II toxin-antitoxin system VapC family toxin [Acidobacteria bacterium]|nr:type II toxin-antitoxin system VapC family toxin [Acidobacteriota bacterium]